MLFRNIVFLLMVTLVMGGPLTGKAKATGAKLMEIPFEYRNNFIILRVEFNQSLPLKFIYDTGAENTILTKKEISDILGIDYDRKFRIVGSDLKLPMYAYLARDIHLQVAEFKAPDQNILVLEDDYIHFEEFIGVNIHGIIGADFFRNYVVEINYRRAMISLYLPDQFEAPTDKFKEVPIDIEKNKPYLTTRVNVNGNDSTRLKLLIDTGASLYLLLITDSHPDLQLPQQHIPGHIGMGLGGYLEGYIGRINILDMGPYSFNNVITNFQERSTITDTTLIFKNGIIGNTLLSRFSIILDNSREKMYLAPNKKKIDKEFKFDKSGLVILATGANLSTYVVNDVIPGSPADEADIRRGDILNRINWIPTSLLSLREVTDKFQKRSGKTMRVVILRGGEKIRKKFILRDLI